MNQRIIFGRHPSEKLPNFLVIYSLQLCILSKGVLTLLVSTSEANLWRTWIIYISWGRIQTWLYALSVRREGLQQMARGIGITSNSIGWIQQGMPDYSLRQIQITEMLIMVGLIHVEQCFTKAVWKS